MGESIVPPGLVEEIRNEWVVIWFAPDGDKTYVTKSEAKARRKAIEPDVAEWNPLLEHRVTTITVDSQLVPL